MARMLKMYGIPNCDTVKKARTWLQARGVAFEFHDFKKHGVPTEVLQPWLASPGWQTLLNRRGTTWRQLDTATQAAVVDAESAAELMQHHPSVIKRPVLVWPHKVTVGFDAEIWTQELASLLT
jgi:Spx/MgsR family transcriptional regulator